LEPQGLSQRTAGLNGVVAVFVKAVLVADALGIEAVVLPDDRPGFFGWVFRVYNHTSLLRGMEAARIEAEVKAGERIAVRWPRLLALSENPLLRWLLHCGPFLSHDDGTTAAGTATAVSIHAPTSIVPVRVMDTVDICGGHDPQSVNEFQSKIRARDAPRLDAVRRSSIFAVIVRLRGKLDMFGGLVMGCHRDQRDWKSPTDGYALCRSTADAFMFRQRVRERADAALAAMRAVAAMGGGGGRYGCLHFNSWQCDSAILWGDELSTTTLKAKKERCIHDELNQVRAKMGRAWPAGDGALFLSGQKDYVSKRWMLSQRRLSSRKEASDAKVDGDAVRTLTDLEISMVSAKHNGGITAVYDPEAGFSMAYQERAAISQHVCRHATWVIGPEWSGFTQAIRRTCGRGGSRRCCVNPDVRVWSVRSWLRDSTKSRGEAAVAIASTDEGGGADVACVRRVCESDNHEFAPWGQACGS